MVCSAAKEQGFNVAKARLHIEADGPISFRWTICRRCAVPACVTACPTHAVELAGGLGIVVIDPPGLHRLRGVRQGVPAWGSQPVAAS